MNKTKIQRCWLECMEGKRPNIEISIDHPTFIGRTRETQLTDTWISKKHCEFTVNPEDNFIHVKMLGVNTGNVKGFVMYRNESYTAHDGDILEMIPKMYPYKVHIEFAKSDKDDHTVIEKKRKRSIESSNGTSSPISKRMKWQIDISSDSKLPFPGETAWESFNNGQLIVYTMADCKASKNIAAYDMDGTLILTKSGKVFPTDVDDWKLAFGTVASTLKAKHAENFKIVIITNQAGISKGKTKLSDIKKKIENIARTLGVPIQAFIATGDNCFRKPLTGMWQALCDYKNNSVVVDMEQSFYVGDAAGRPENKSIKKKKDHSAVDRLLALNLNLTFFTPEEHFLKAKPQKWNQPEFHPKAILCDSINLTGTPNALISSDNLEVILMVGGPGSGKSRFCKDHLETKNYEVVSRDVLGSWQKCVDRVNDCLRSNRKVVVDNTNGDKDSRARYVNAAKKHKVPCRCFVMSTTFKHAEHNIAFRELTDSKHTKISNIVLNSYKKHYQEPALGEGFTEIVRVNFVPSFQNDKEKSLYEMYLLSS